MKPPCELDSFVFQQQQSLGQRFVACGMHLSPPPPNIFDTEQHWCWLNYVVEQSGQIIYRFYLSNSTVSPLQEITSVWC